MSDQISILVAEDEEWVRFVIAEALRDEGFEVMEAEHAEGALGVLRMIHGRIHVLFTDIQMPGPMDGLALAHHTSKHWPRMGLLITSARPFPDRAFPEKSRFLAKPYQHRHVIRHIHELAAHLAAGGGAIRCVEAGQRGRACTFGRQFTGQSLHSACRAGSSSRPAQGSAAD